MYAAYLELGKDANNCPCARFLTRGYIGGFLWIPCEGSATVHFLNIVVNFLYLAPFEKRAEISAKRAEIPRQSQHDCRMNTFMFFGNGHSCLFWNGKIYDGNIRKSHQNLPWTEMCTVTNEYGPWIWWYCGTFAARAFSVYHSPTLIFYLDGYLASLSIPVRSKELWDRHIVCEVSLSPWLCSPECSALSDGGKLAGCS